MAVVKRRRAVTRVCPCGQPATHRVHWHAWHEACQAIPSVKRPAWCYACATREARQRTGHRRALADQERDYPDRERLLFCSTTPLPEPWLEQLRATVRLQGHATIVPGGLIKFYARGGHAWVEIYPPREKEDTWSAENALYLLRYLSGRPVVFRAMPLGSMPVPTPGQWHASRRQWHATQPPVVEDRPLKDE